MRQAVLPENFQCDIQDQLFGFLDTIYDDGPQIACCTGEAGTGKSHGFRQYEATAKERHREREQQRPAIAFEDVKARFRAEGCLKTKEDQAWLPEAWLEKRRPQRISERVLQRMLARRLHEVGRDEDAITVDLRPVDRPCPHVVIVTPSQCTTEVGMIRLLSLCVTGHMYREPGIFHPHQELLDRIRRDRDLFVIIDEAQRLRADPLNIVRELHDDAGATVVIAGTPELEGMLMRRGMESLLSRITIHHRMGHLGPEQVQKLLPGWEPRLVRRIYAHTGGVFRRIKNLAELCEQIREINEKPRVTGEILDQAVRHIPDLLPDAVGRREVLGAPPHAASAKALAMIAPVVGVAMEAPMLQARQARG